MKISEIKSKGIEITWTLLLICFNSNNLLKNSDFDQSFVSGYEIVSYAINLLNVTSDSRIISLAILKENEREEIVRLLRLLSEDESCNYDYEFKKFRAMYIEVALPDANEDFMHGILRISEIWNQFGFPEDSPNTYIEFKEFSSENFMKLLDVHVRWLEQEFKSLTV